MPHSTPAPLRLDRLDPAMVPIYRAMTPAQRVAAGLSATDLIRARLRATLLESHPDWTGEQIAQAVAERLLSARN